MKLFTLLVSLLSRNTLLSFSASRQLVTYFLELLIPLLFSRTVVSRRRVFIGQRGARIECVCEERRHLSTLSTDFIEFTKLSSLRALYFVTNVITLLSRVRYLTLPIYVFRGTKILAIFLFFFSVMLFKRNTTFRRVLMHCF